jgi:hypothetical protein
MKTHAAVIVFWLATSQLLAAASPNKIKEAAARSMPDVNWRVRSVVTDDFTCRGRKEAAILGVSATEIVISVFVEGLNQRPQVLRYSRKARRAETAQLTVESLDDDPDYPLPGFQRSRSCKGLNLSDGETDSAHIYWNRNSRRFDDWSL